MQRLENVSPEEMPEVVRIASELYEQDQAQSAQDQTRQAYVDAAGEVGLPEEYLQRAAAEMHARRVERIQHRRRMRTGLLATLGAVVALGGLWSITHRPPPPPLHYTFQSNAQWRLDKNPQSIAGVTFDQDGVATIHVDRFGKQEGPNPFYVNLDTTDVPQTLSGYHTVRFQARGDGLSSIRLYIENGPTERWRSPALPLSSEWQIQQLRLDQFDYQTRADANDSWRRQSSRLPGHIERLSFKTGWYTNNNVKAHGTISLRDLNFQ